MSSSPTVAFDPYEQWLGIPPGEQPPDHYRLLGLARFESDLSRIEAAADERMSLVRKHQTGPRGIVTQSLLNELAAARNCLMSVEARQEYDDRLRQRLAQPPLAKVISPPTPAADPPIVASPKSPSAPPVDDYQIEDEPPRPSPWSWMRSFVGMAMAVILVAGMTFGVGQYLLRDPQPQQSQAVIPPDREPDPEQDPLPLPETKADGKKSAVVVLQEGSLDVNLTAATAVLTGNVRLTPTGGDEILDRWSQPGDQASWEFKLLRPGFFELELSYAANAEAGENALAVSLNQREVKSCTLQPTGSLEEWRIQRHTLAITASGRHTLSLRLADQVEPGMLVIKGIRLTPVGTPSGKQ